MRRACIDIGSNTTRLLVADYDGTVLAAHLEIRAFTRLGQSLSVDGLIPAAKFDEVGAAVAAQTEAARAAGATEVVCIATAGVRRAANGEDLVRAVERHCPGVFVTVLSEAEEARYTFIGAQSQFPAGTERALRAVVDVGGGSTEIVVGRAPDTIEWWSSIPLGSSDLQALGLDADPPGSAELSAAQASAAREFTALSPPIPDVAVAVGGSAGSLQRITGGQLDQGSFEHALSVLCDGPAAEVAERTGLEASRIGTLPAGLIVLQAVGELLGQPLWIGSAGLREGVLLAGQ